MRQQLYILWAVFSFACGSLSSNKKEVEIALIEIDTMICVPTKASDAERKSKNIANQDYATYFVVVADTSQDYYFLHEKMLGISRQLGYQIDTMGRSFNPEKNLIALPENSEDEIYAGDYFPRRFPSDYLSLEYLNFYKRDAGGKTMGLVTGIFEIEKSADSAVAVLYGIEKKGFKVKAEIYVGCMH